MAKGYLNVWVGTYGEYAIPEAVFALVKRFTKSGMPDRRYAGNTPFWAWVQEQEEKAARRWKK